MSRKIKKQQATMSRKERLRSRRGHATGSAPRILTSGAIVVVAVLASWSVIGMETA